MVKVKRRKKSDRNIVASIFFCVFVFFVNALMDAEELAFIEQEVGLKFNEDGIKYRVFGGEAKHGRIKWIIKPRIRCVCVCVCLSH